MRLSRGSRWFLASLLLVLAAGAAGLWWVDVNLLEEGIEPGQPVEYTVERGTSVGEVGDDLVELGVVSSGFRFRSVAGDADLATELQPGIFELETGMSHEDAVETLAAGPAAPLTVRFTVPEGLTVDQTLQTLAESFEAHEVEDFEAVLDERTAAGEIAADEDDEAALLGTLQLPDWVPEPADAGDQIEPYEGLFWPETYEVEDEATPRQILQRMVDQLIAEFEQLEADLGEDEAIDDRYELLTVASLVERETWVDDERSTVAGVIVNRLEEEMPLQIDATVVYALGGGPREQVTFDDLEVDSPYNTYENPGLPPTPISGAGRASLRAAAQPDDVDFRFYVLDAACDGTHRFAETGEEHQQNVEAFREADRCIDQDLGGGPLDEVER
ncbi:MAG: endolytic transglycosylase MltG [Nitriliruptoraceae bacterium]